jgi:hypothetical protein
MQKKKLKKERPYSLCSSTVPKMMCVGIDAFLFSVLDWGEWSAACFGFLTPGATE